MDTKLKNVGRHSAAVTTEMLLGYNAAFLCTLRPNKISVASLALCLPTLSNFVLEFTLFSYRRVYC